VLVEKPHIVAQLLAFYANKKRLEENGFTLFFVEEAWIDMSFTAKRCWRSVDQPGHIPPCNRGQRLIVVHAGSHDGFIEDADLVYKATSRTGD